MCAPSFCQAIKTISENFVAMDFIALALQHIEFYQSSTRLYKRKVLVHQKVKFEGSV
jgi:hypothetical protein